ncbi:MAG: hypothetical protein JST21_07540 [Bacteroidetes bacterium]|nr:hypothetical protein [Bacteroidota bacterium]
MMFRMLIAIATIFILTACSNRKTSDNRKDTVITNLNAITTELPDKPGYATFKQNCMICHSARYIQIQPSLPEKTWSAIVIKMQKNFGAPVDDSSAKEIIKYLVSIKGKE